jgi:lipoprotein-anchoring transpeptidase ErfK/SrfK
MATHLSNLSAKRHLVVNQDEQLMFVYENDTIIYTIPVSTGAPVTNRFTPPWQGVVGDDWGGGWFRNQQRADFMWFLFPGPEGSILIHSVPYTITADLKVHDQLESLGVEPVSNGCIRVSPENGAWLKNWGPVGVPITITRWSGKIQPSDSIQESTVEEKINE